MKETQETRIRSLGQEELLEKEMGTHSNFLIWEIPWTEKSGGLQSMQNSQTQLSDQKTTFYLLILHKLFIHSFLKDHLGNFQVLDIIEENVLSASVQIFVYKLAHRLYFLLDKHLEVEW